MTVYVDEAVNRYGRMLMCHMLADTPAELHGMADFLGLRRSWYQGGASTPHYDICKRNRRLAVLNGAVEVDRRATARLVKRIRTSGAYV